MGRQISFYMTIDDEKDFLEFLHSTGNVVILGPVSTTVDGKTFDDLLSLRSVGQFHSCHLWNQSISPIPLYRKIRAEGPFRVDFLDSEVVNMITSTTRENRIHMGRLHLETQCLDSTGSSVRKSEKFLAWYDKLCRWFRRTCREKHNGAWLSNKAAELAKSGVELTGYNVMR